MAELKINGSIVHWVDTGNGKIVITEDSGDSAFLEIIDASSNKVMSFDGTTITFSNSTTFAGDITVSGSITKTAQTFHANAFQYPNPGTDWTPELKGAGLGASASGKKCWIPLNFLKVGDVIDGYTLYGANSKTNTTTVDCKLVKINKGSSALSTTDITDGAITQVTADGVFSAASSSSTLAETVTTKYQYALEIQGTTSTSDAITVIGAEVSVDRK